MHRVCIDIAGVNDLALLIILVGVNDLALVMISRVSMILNWQVNLLKWHLLLLFYVQAFAAGVFSGVLAGYVAYDCMHYLMHR